MTSGHPLADPDDLDLRAYAVQLEDSGGESLGSGFLATQGIVATCAHNLIRNGSRLERVTLKFPESQETVDAIVDEDLWQARGLSDVAFLRLEGPPPNTASVAPFGERHSRRGQSLAMYGFTAGGQPDGQYGFGIAGKLVPAVTGGGLWLQLTESTEATSGFSGGPAVDEQSGLITGMVVKVTTPDVNLRGDETTFVIPVQEILALCPEIVPAAQCPYRELEPFSSDDADIYFGRDDAVRLVTSALLAAPECVLLLGPSGSGKSSLVRAGVLPSLQQHHSSQGWQTVMIRGLDNPYAQLQATGLTAAADDLTRAVESWLADHPDCSRLIVAIQQGSAGVAVWVGSAGSGVST